MYRQKEMQQRSLLDTREGKAKKGKPNEEAQTRRESGSVVVTMMQMQAPLSHCFSGQVVGESICCCAERWRFGGCEPLSGGW
jgi:hypothetical protein